MTVFQIPGSIKVTAIALMAAALSSCSEVASLLPGSQPSPDVAVSPTATVPANPAPGATAAPASPPPGTAAPASPAPAGSPQGTAPSTRCNAATYFSEVVTEGGQPRLTLGRTTGGTDVNQAIATQTVNPDNSTTFTSNTEGSILYTRVYPNGNCLIQSVASRDGSLVFEEYGRTGG